LYLLAEDLKERLADFLSVVIGMFYWVESLQSYDVGGWNYIDKLKSWVDKGMNGDEFINSVSGIVNRGCHNPVSLLKMKLGLCITSMVLLRA
jgi:hypothetical protein